jgi:hypothetical protein
MKWMDALRLTGWIMIFIMVMLTLGFGIQAMYEYSTNRSDPAVVRELGMQPIINVEAARAPEVHNTFQIDPPVINVNQFSEELSAAAADAAEDSVNNMN